MCEYVYIYILYTMVYKRYGSICHIFTKLIRGQFFKCEAGYNIGYCNYSLVLYVIFCNIFSILINLYCLHGCLLK